MLITQKQNLSNGSVANSTEKKVVVIDKLEIKFVTFKNINKLDDIDMGLRLLEIAKTEAMNTNRHYGREYRNCSKVFYKDVEVANIFYRQNIGEPTNGIIVFKNSTFYTNFKSYFNDLITNEELGLEMISIYKLDLALDVNSICHLKRLNSKYLQYSSGRVHLLNGTEFIERKPRGSYYVGANKYINIYNKIDELKRNNKHYILDFYRENRFNFKSGITRIELRLARKKGGFIARLIDKLDLFKIVNTNYIGNITKQVFDKKLWLVYKDNKNRSRCTKERLLNINYGEYTTEVNYSKSEKDKTASKNRMKTILKTLTFEWLDKNGELYGELHTNLMRKIDVFNLEDWFYNYINGNTFNSEFETYKDLYC